MASIDGKRYYWLKLDKDFFKRHDVKIVESMPNGKDYILFYLKLLCESTSHEGYLRFSPTLPYSEEMLATITNTNIDIVRTAIKVFTGLDMMKFLDDGTLYLEQVERMIGMETGAAIRKRQERAALGTNRDKQGHCPQEIDIEIDKESEIDIDTEKDKEKESDRNKYKQIETNKSKLTLPESLAYLLVEKGYITFNDMKMDGYDELYERWLDEHSAKDLKVKTQYFLKANRRELGESDNRYCYFRDSMERALSRGCATMEDMAKALEEAGREIFDEDY